MDQQGQFRRGSPNGDHGCGVLPVHKQQYSGLGCPLAGINCSWHLVPGPIPTTHQCPGASSHMAWAKSFQPESGEHLSVLPDRLSQRGQILKTEWSLTRPYSRQDFSCLGRPFVDLFALGKNTKLATYISPIREETAWNVDSLELGWPVCLCVPSNKPDKGMSKQGQNRKRRDHPDSPRLAEWFPDLLDLAIDFPISLPPVQKLLKQTFSHHFHPHPWNLGLHAWRLSRDSTRREDFLKLLPKGSLYLRDNPQWGFMNLSGRCLESGAMLTLSLAAFYWPDLPVLAAILDKL